MKRLEVSIDDAARGIYRVTSLAFEDEDADKLLELQKEVNEILKQHGIETRFVNPTTEVKVSAKESVS